METVDISPEIKRELQILIEFLAIGKKEDQIPKGDAIFLFGHYDPRPAIQAAKLWKLGKAPIIIISGKGRDKIPKGFETEADFYASIIEKEGVPHSALILEKESTNTLENILLGITAYKERNQNISSVILCSIPLHLCRVRATFQKQFPNIEVYPNSFDLPIQELLNTSRIHYILGEFDRMKKYAEKGDTLEIKLPREVSDSIIKIQNFIA